MRLVKFLSLTLVCIFLGYSCRYTTYYYKSANQNNFYIFLAQGNAYHYYPEKKHLFAFWPPLEEHDNLDSLLKKAHEGWGSIENRYKVRIDENKLIYVRENRAFNFELDPVIVQDSVLLPFSHVFIQFQHFTGQTFIKNSDMFTARYIKDSLCLFHNRNPEVLKLFEFYKIEKNDSLSVKYPVIIGFSQKNGMPLYFQVMNYNYGAIEKDVFYCTDYSLLKRNKRTLMKLLPP